jgi:hypothetical protein
MFSRPFRRLLLEFLQTAFDTGGVKLSTALERLRNRAELFSFLQPVNKSRGLSGAKPPFTGPEKRSNTPADIPTAQLSRTKICQNICTREFSSQQSSLIHVCRYARGLMLLSGHEEYSRN